MNTKNSLQKHLSPAGVWAFAIGTAIGWGSLVVTASTYLAQAGPAGSVLGLIAGSVIMLVIAVNYSYLMRRSPDAGGAYAFTTEAFNHDFGFLASWFLSMTYLAILWANATSLPLFGRIFLGGIFRFGKMYTIFGYEVYAGEVLLSMAALLLFGILCMRRASLTDTIMIVLACLFTAAIVICFLGAVFSHNGTMKPAFLPDSSALKQIVKIAVISPWAFIGFESISHASEEFDFDRNKLPRLMLIIVVSTLLLYVFVTLLSVTAYPARYDSWLAYIQDLDNLEGIEALPAFYAASTYLGGAGVTMLMLALLSLVITSLIGNMSALSRLFYALAKDRILPERFAALNAQGIPQNALWLVVGLSILIPLLGRTAIGWIVDVTTIGATLIYGLVSAAAMRLADKEGDRRVSMTGKLGLGIMIVFGAYILLPNLISTGSMAKETFFLFIVWSVLGFIFFRYILSKDNEKRFGKTIIVWTALLALVLFVSLVWMRQSMIDSNHQMMTTIQEYYNENDGPDAQRTADENFVEEQIEKAEAQDTRTIMMAIGMFAFALVIMLSNHSFMQKRNEESERMANIDPMTGVKSKHAYLASEKQFDEAISEHRAGEFAVAVCDVNGLKKINDTLGHKAGDEYIKSASKVICDIFQHSPVYRTGGDEFVVILTGRDFMIRKELVLALHDRSVENINSEQVVISSGYSDFDPEHDINFHDVFERADSLMYEEKQLLKGLGSISRDEVEAAPAIFSPADEDIIKLKRSVLIVEDEEVSQMLLGNALAESYDLLYASDGVEALAQIKSHKDELALVLLDLKMPRMSGNEVLKIVKEEKELSEIPVIVMTADQSAEVECLRNGAIDFIPKPYPAWEIVLARVNRCIELSEKRSIIQTTERDSLTKLFNMDYFLRYVRIYDQRYTDKDMDAIVMDVNNFHVLNERYGKQYGDVILSRIGERVRGIAREVGGVGCRRGADTFLIYCPHRDDYVSILEKVSDGLTGDDPAAANRVRLRMGVYENVDKSIEIERRFDYAKIAANSVKTGYIKAVGMYDDEMREAEMFKERLLEDFRPSLDNGHFMVYFQPKFDIRPDTPMLSSAEALVRWNHPELGLISPGMFIPLLEDNGLILELDQFVWCEAAARIRDWKDRFGYSVPVSVNVSRIDMLTPNLKSIFREILEKYGLDTEDLILEITESAYTGDSEQVISTAKDLRGMGMGFRIEMDDFGTGYSSLGMLTNLPIDALKLDMSFIRSAFGENRDVRMIELIIDIADYLHVPVVAEGVETEEQYLVLKAMGCDIVQGYYFSKPVPAESFDRFLIERTQEKQEISTETKKTYVSISKALTSNFESIFYVDVVTDFYLEFYSGKAGDLEIRPGGVQFFDDMQEKLLDGICEEDVEKVRTAVSKVNLMRWAGQEETASLSFRKLRGGVQTPYILQTIKTRESDDHHVVIGIRPE